MSDLETYYPGIKAKLVDWLINYKTSDGKPQNTLASNEPASSSEAIEIINQVHGFYKDLIAPGSKKNTYGFYLPNSPHSNSYSSSSSNSVDTPKSDSISSSSKIQIPITFEVISNTDFLSISTLKTALYSIEVREKLYTNGIETALKFLSNLENAV
jgi:hypothetical protein